MGAGDLEIWLNHFEHHALHPRCAARGLSDVLRADERELIASSIATFQLGERSEGRTLLRAAECFGREKQVPHLLRIVELLIREEQRHASLLRAFMPLGSRVIEIRRMPERIVGIADGVDADGIHGARNIEQNSVAGARARR